jgi:hypothetical protein
MREELLGGWREEVGRMCVMHGRKEECIQRLRWENMKTEDSFKH